MSNRTPRSLLASVVLALVAALAPAARAQDDFMSLDEYLLSMDFVQMSAAAYQRETFVAGDLDRGFWQVREFFRDDTGETALNGGVWERVQPGGRREIAIVFAGTASAGDFWTDVEQFIEGPDSSAQYRAALRVSKKYVAEVANDPSATVYVGGHSLGGGIAFYISAKLGLRGFSFCGAGLTDWPFKDLSVAEVEGTKRRFVEVRPYADFVSAMPGRHPDRVITVEPSTPTSLLNQWGEGGRHFLAPLAASMRAHYFGNRPGVRVEQRHESYHEETRAGERVRTYYLAADSPDSMTTARLMAEMPRNAHTAVVVGIGPQADHLAEAFEREHGRGSVHRVAENPSGDQAFDLARRYGTSTVFHVAPTSYHRSIGAPGFGPRPARPSAATQPSPPRVEVERPDPPRLRDDTVVPPPSIHPPFFPPYRPPPPPPPSARLEFPSGGRVGGVMLRGAASVEGGEELGSGAFALVFDDAAAGLDFADLRRFVTALWAVYFSADGPGISIDPIAPDVDVHAVRYIGHVRGSDLGRVMREADYLMKKWSVGTERAALAGFANPDDIAARIGFARPNHSRFWFVPDGMRFALDGGFLRFDGGRMTLRTEYLEPGRAGADPSNEEFAAWFTREYDAIAAEYAVFRELHDYGRLVSLARYLKDARLPLAWYLLANKDLVLTEQSPETVAALAKKSDHFPRMEIRGGVDLALRVAPTAGGARGPRPGVARASESWPSAVLADARGESAAISPSAELSLSRGDTDGEIYQTDLSLWLGAEPGIDLVRAWDPARREPGEFGPGWHVALPYEVERTGDATREFAGAEIPREMRVRNLLTGREEVLGFDEERYGIAGYLPRDGEGSSLIGLFLLSNGGFRLADHVGAEFEFDPAGRLTEMCLAPGFAIHVERRVEEIAAEERGEVPVRLRPAGDETVETHGVHLPRRLELAEGSRARVFVFDDADALDVVGYVRERAPADSREHIALLSDASFRLTDGSGTEIDFDAAGCLSSVRRDVVASLSRGEQRVELDYEPAGTGVRVARARVIVGGAERPELAAHYAYDTRGRLFEVARPGGETISIRTEHGTVVASVSSR